MANIRLTQLYQQKGRQYGSSDLARFAEDFPIAVNRAINEINQRADLATKISRIDSTEDTVELDEKYEDVLSVGVDMNLLIMGARPPKGMKNVVKTFREMFYDGIDRIRQNISNLASAADDDDEDDDIIGLGPLG